MAQSSTRGTCEVPAICDGVHAGEMVLWMVSHPAAATIMTADAKTSRHEPGCCILLMSFILRLQTVLRPYRRRHGLPKLRRESVRRNGAHRLFPASVMRTQMRQLRRIYGENGSRLAWER